MRCPYNNIERTDGGVIPETDPAYRKVYSPYDLATAILDSNKTAGAVKVIEIKHAIFNIKGANNIIIRNLKFDEMWEWDEDSKGNHPRSRALWA